MQGGSAAGAVQSAVSGRSRSRSAGPGPTLALSCSRPGDSQGVRYTDQGVRYTDQGVRYTPTC